MNTKQINVFAALRLQTQCEPKCSPPPSAINAQLSSPLSTVHAYMHTVHTVHTSHPNPGFWGAPITDCHPAAQPSSAACQLPGWAGAVVGFHALLRATVVHVWLFPQTRGMSKSLSRGQSPGPIYDTAGSLGQGVPAAAIPRAKRFDDSITRGPGYHEVYNAS